MTYLLPPHTRRATGTTALASFKTPQPTDVGYVEEMVVDEIGSQEVGVVQQQSDQGQLSTIVARGSTENILDEVERCLDDGVNAYRALCRDSRMVAGGGAAEIEVAQQVGVAEWEGVEGIADVWVVVYLVEVDPNGGDVQACRFKSI